MADYNYRSDYCLYHSDSKGGYAARREREKLDEKIKPLPLNQAGEGKHKCVYCAYEAGYKNGREDMKRQLKKRVIEQITAWFDNGR